MFDLYSGTGTISQLLAPVAKEVIGVEIVEDAVKAARENARAEWTYQLQIYCRRCAESSGRPGRKAGCDRAGSAKRRYSSQGSSEDSYLME